MTKFIAMAGLSLLILGLGVSGARAERSSNTMDGILADRSENLLVIRTRDGKEHLFWITGELNCDAEKGDPVRATFRKEERSVKNLLTLQKL